jgi:hypothetical protein
MWTSCARGSRERVDPVIDTVGEVGDEGTASSSMSPVAFGTISVSVAGLSVESLD